MAEGDNTQTVVAFIGAVNRNDKDGILGFFRLDSVFHNIPMRARSWTAGDLENSGARPRSLHGGRLEAPLDCGK